MNQILTATEIAGFAGAGLAGAAYVPQISHLIRARCAAGISRLAFEAWLLASLLTTARAIAIHAGVFIVLGGIQIVATALIVAYAARYKDIPCPIHLPGQPTDETAAEAPLAEDGPGHCGRPQLANATHGRGSLARLRAFSRRRGTNQCRRALRRRCRSYLRQCTGFPATHLTRAT